MLQVDPDLQGSLQVMVLGLGGCARVLLVGGVIRFGTQRVKYLKAKAGFRKLYGVFRDRRVVGLGCEGLMNTS